MTTRPTPVPPIISAELNRELATVTLDFLRANQARHRQSTWINGEVRVAHDHPELRGAELAALLTDTPPNVCGTAGCFAGWASLFGGWRQIGGYDSVVNPADRHDQRSMREAAQVSLGLTDAQARVLFDADNTIDELAVMVEHLLADPTTDLRAEEVARDQRLGEAQDDEDD